MQYGALPLFSRRNGEQGSTAKYRPRSPQVPTTLAPAMFGGGSKNADANDDDLYEGFNYNIEIGGAPPAPPRVSPTPFRSLSMRAAERGAPRGPAPPGWHGSCLHGRGHSAATWC